MSPTKQAIDALIFDSGVGGLSILRDILRARPNLSFAYLADNAGLPYGDKTPEWLEERVSQVIAAALEIYTPAVIVIACNTASTLVLPKIRSEVKMPVVGVVPAIKPAATQSQTKVIGLLATPATVTRVYTDGLIQDFAKDCQVIRVGSSRLVEMVEQHLRGRPLSMDELKRICEPFLVASPLPDIIVLGCTHFPLIPEALRSVLPGMSLIDSGKAIAQRTESILGPPETSSHPARRSIHFTALDASITELQPYLRSLGLEPARPLTLAKESDPAK